GKTRLFDELLRTARDLGQPVLLCRAARSEMGLSYVGLMELLRGLGEEVVRALPAPQTTALNVTLRREAPEGPFDRLSLSVAVLAAVRALASSGPVVVAVDDLQWLDT